MYILYDYSMKLGECGFQLDILLSVSSTFYFKIKKKLCHFACCIPIGVTVILANENYIIFNCYAIFFHHLLQIAKDEQMKFQY